MAPILITLFDPLFGSPPLTRSIAPLSHDRLALCPLYGARGLSVSHAGVWCSVYVSFHLGVIDVGASTVLCCLSARK